MIRASILGVDMYRANFFAPHCVLVHAFSDGKTKVWKKASNYLKHSRKHIHGNYWYVDAVKNPIFATYFRTVAALGAHATRA